MNKEFFTVFIVVFALLAGTIRYTDPLHGYFLSGLNGIKNFYWNTLESIDHTIDEHFNQQKTIISLRDQLARYQEEHLLLQSLAHEFNALVSEKATAVPNRTEIKLARAISYAKFGDRNKIWLSMEEYNTTKMYGLVRNGKAAGIVIEKLGKPLALLNGDGKSSYAVYIGKNKAPGIVRGKNTQEMIVEYIPMWISVLEGDEVHTSGLDHLFYEGIPVGKVLSIKQQQGFQTAVIKTYANTDQLGYFHAIEQQE